MRHLTRWIGAGLFSLAGMGCVAANFPGAPSAGDLARDLIPDEMPPMARMQRGDDAPIVVAQVTLPLSIPTSDVPQTTVPPLSIPNPSLGTPRATTAPVNSAPIPFTIIPARNIPAPLPSGPPVVVNNLPTTVNIAPPPGISLRTVSQNAPPPSIPAPVSSSATMAPPPLSAANIPPPPSTRPGGTQQASLKSRRASHVAVCAWVNGRPIFDDEVILQLEMTNPAVLRETSMEKVTQAYNQTLGSIIDLEIAYQDAVKKLEKGNPKALEKLREMVNQDYDKQARAIRKSVPEEKFQEIAPTFRRQLERQFIGMEYVRSRIIGQVNSVGYQEVKDYYDTHRNEFQKIESVKWQHAFIAVNALRPSVADAKRYGQGLLAQLPPNADFAGLAKFDDGDSKTRGGMGFGNRRGEIQPVELEKHLFEMRDGQIGPIIDVSTGVHLFRLVERDPGGLLPLNETVQAQIRNKIKSQIFDREFKRLIKELKGRADIRVAD